MLNNKLLLIITVALLAGCTSKQEKACQEEANVAETVMQARLTYGGFAEATYMLAGDNDELREQLRPMIHDAFEYERGGLATYEATKQQFKDKYYQQCMGRPAP
ncbi:hypothetical protein ACNAUY_16320 [Acinetobacter tibetensis]|uniref:hypothetical protein n=1 Tax=Acinetobacter tibetensis TaxID=2943497 RepID=UPI003A4D9D0C